MKSKVNKPKINKTKKHKNHKMDSKKNKLKGGLFGFSNNAVNLEVEKEFSELGFENTIDNFEKELCVYVIHGMGCNSSAEKKFISELKNSMAIVNTKKITFKYVCHDKEEKNYLTNMGLKIFNQSSIRNIGRLKFGVSPFPGNYITQQTDILKEILLTHRYVIIYAHSFGGAIANAIAKNINVNPEFDKVRDRVMIKAFGSIYIPWPSEINRVKIENYMLIGDLSLRYNFLLPPSSFEENLADPYLKRLHDILYENNKINKYNQTEFIKKENSLIWIDTVQNKEVRSNPGKSFNQPLMYTNFFGTLGELNLHNTYFNFIIKNMQNKWKEIMEFDLGYKPQFIKSL